MAILVLFAGFCVLLAGAKPEGSENICHTKECIQVAETMVKNMDEHADPCNDFYQFACGGFEKNTLIPPNKAGIDQQSSLRDEIEENLDIMLQEDPDPNEPEIFDTVRNFYKSCIDTDGIEKNSVSDLKRLLEEVGGFPVLEGANWNESGFDSNNLAVKLQSLGLKGPMFVNIKLEEGEIKVREVDMGKFRTNLLVGRGSKFPKAHLKYLIETAKFLGASDSVAKKDMKDVLNLQTEISHIMRPQENPRYMTIKELSKMYPNVKWIDLINEYLNGSTTINIDEKVSVYTTTSYLENIQNILAHTSARVQANFQISQSIPMNLLPEDGRTILDHYKAVTSYPSKRKPRWKVCLKNIGNFRDIDKIGLRIATSAMYVRKYFSSEAKELIDKMVHDIFDEFEIIINEIDWMAEEAKAKSLDSIHYLKPYIGYSGDLLNDTYLEEYYRGLQFSSNGFLNNSLQMTKYFTKKYQEEINPKHIFSEYQMIVKAYVDQVMAQCKPGALRILLTAGHLKGAYFGVDRPMYMDYGAIGYIFGHEVMHAIDWNLANSMDSDMVEDYLERTSCVVEEYGNFTYMMDGQEIHVDGILTKGENIADIGGMKVAYRTYQRLFSSMPENTLPGLPYSPSQLFWLAGANTRCSNIKAYVWLNKAHSPDKFRVNGPFSNLEEFARDWNCPVGSNMNPARKCHVW